MKILIVRHADPNYVIDGLTEKGVKEAEFLSERLCKERISSVYCSTMGRARLTAEPTLNKLNIKAEYCDWLREFIEAPIKLDYLATEKYCWDILPEYLEKREEIYDPKMWKEVDFVKESDVVREYDKVCAEFDELMKRHGYIRRGINYRAVESNHDTVLLVCHFGVEAVIVSHILNCSPYSIWQNAFAAPTSVTTFFTEERANGVVSLRCCGFGDVSHLYKHDEEPSFAGRFCECFTDNTRHE